jgi:hypothetical protein
MTDPFTEHWLNLPEEQREAARMLHGETVAVTSVDENGEPVVYRDTVFFPGVAEELRDEEMLEDLLDQPLHTQPNDHDHPDKDDHDDR